MNRVMLSVVFAFVLSATTAAHFVFVVPDGAGASATVVLSETLVPDSQVDVGLIAGAALTLRDASGRETPLTLTKAAHAFVAPLPPGASGLVHGVVDLGVITMGGAPHTLRYYPKSIVGDAFAASARVGDVPVEIVPLGAAGALRLQLLVGKAPQRDAEVTVILPDGSQKAVKTDADGRTEVFAQRGQYGAWARHWETASGDLQGKRYEQIGYYATLVFQTETAAQSARGAATGIVIMAHGGNAGWNDEVLKLTRSVDGCAPAELALGMANRGSIQAAIDRLVARGVGHVVAVPLFVSSHSSVIEATRYLLGVRKDAPPELAMFARMDHGHGQENQNATDPIQSTTGIRMTSALDRHATVAAILTARAREISRAPEQEVVIVVAHGPESDAENARWMADMEALSRTVGADTPFARVEYLTVRDDAAPAIREAASVQLRQAVQKVSAEGRRALLVPLLMSYGGIEAGIRKRLDGLDYTMALKALLPDDRLAGWVLESAGQSCKF